MYTSEPLTSSTNVTDAGRETARADPAQSAKTEDSAHKAAILRPLLGCLNPRVFFQRKGTNTDEGDYTSDICGEPLLRGGWRFDTCRSPLAASGV